MGNHTIIIKKLRMNNFTKLTLLAILATWIIGCTMNSADSDLAPLSVDVSVIQQAMDALASDEFMGRKPFTEGETKTINYLENTLKTMGLQPGNGGSFLQKVPLVEVTGLPASTMQIEGPKSSHSLAINKDYVIFTQRLDTAVALVESPIVFCGYGIVAPEYGWNDYEGMDMKGKTALVLVNDPGFESGDSTLFQGNTMTYYGRWTYKYEEAARQGAAGILIVHETRAAGYPWFVVENSWSGSKLDLQTADGNAGLPAIQGWVTLPTVAKILGAAGLKGTDIFSAAKSLDFKPIPLGVQASTTLHNTLKTDFSYNVLGMIEGNERPEEYIIYTAHWDHLGVGTPVEGDSIYNGGVDNASGTASVLSIAAAFAKGPTPKRSVVFLFVTAEEQGLLGSAYYAHNPVYPIDQTVANLNMDGMHAYGPTKDLVITGFGQSEMDDYAAAVAKNQGRYVVPDLEPEKGYFYRSDHFNFAKVGIPALYAKGGTDHLENGKAYGEEASKAYLAKDYHQPSDHFDPEKWDLRGLEQDANLFLQVGQQLANEDYYPKWKEGSAFKKIREKTLAD